jgi:hypothetical protein
MQQFAGAGDGFARQLRREFRRQPGLDAGARQFLGEQENVGRAGAGHRGDRVHQILVIDPFDRSGGAQQRVGHRALRRADVARRHRDGDAAADRGRRIGHGAHHATAADLVDRSDGHAGHDRHHQRGRPNERLQVRPGFAKHLRLQRHHQGGDRADLARRRIEANACRHQRADLSGRIRLDHRDPLGIEPARQPARQHRAAHLAGAGERDGAGEIL